MITVSADSELAAPAEVAFIADISDREVHRIIDERILPDTLYEQINGRRFLRLACAFAHFYFDTDKDLSKSLRKSVIEQITKKVLLRSDRDQLLSLTSPIVQGDWTVKFSFGTLELNDFVLQTQRRARLVDRANNLIVVDEEIMGGEPVFKGTRIPVHNIAASLKLGIANDQILGAFPDLSKEMVSVAEVYAKVYPRRGRPHKISDKYPSWVKLANRKIAAPIKK
ncbi:uncharacterized protein (DUF433 family) [Oxalobacteraceae bacterium GrIS 2.11]